MTMRESLESISTGWARDLREQGASLLVHPYLLFLTLTLAVWVLSNDYPVLDRGWDHIVHLDPVVTPIEIPYSRLVFVEYRPDGSASLLDATRGANSIPAPPPLAIRPAQRAAICVMFEPRFRPAYCAAGARAGE